ncbi:hypothetical protein VNO77_02437 [Canavalia gladiata]|uniref:Uncharacterized protein n=1 Tax=Canavalia gladiata TaxID=3824 RepID=A0AAN9MY87_CANGL
MYTFGWRCTSRIRRISLRLHKLPLSLPRVQLMTSANLGLPSPGAVASDNVGSILHPTLVTQLKSSWHYDLRHMTFTTTERAIFVVNVKLIKP